MRPTKALQVMRAEPLMIWMDRIRGAELELATVTAKVLVALKGGWPLSVTTVVKMFELRLSPAGAVQLMIPVASICAPAGGATRR